MSEQVVTFELDGEVAIIGLNRPDKPNALSPELRSQLRYAALRAGEEAKCGIIYGHGEDFCAGLDLPRGQGVLALDSLIVREQVFTVLASNSAP